MMAQSTNGKAAINEKQGEEMKGTVDIKNFKNITEQKVSVTR